MSFLQKDSAKAQGGGMVDTGTYEVFIKAVDPNKVAGTGKTGMELLYVVRDDVEQAFRGSKIYDNIWDSAEWRYHQLTDAAGAEDGHVFETKKDVADFVKGKAIKVTVKKEKRTWNGETKDTINVQRIEPSDFAEGFVAPTEDAPATSADPFANDGKPIDITDDDLPF